MLERGQVHGKINSNAPFELSQFGFLIGKFRCEASLKQANGSWQSLKGEWDGRFILDGYAIEDEYRMHAPTGELIVLGMNFRSYDLQKRRGTSNGSMHSLGLGSISAPKLSGVFTSTKMESIT